MPISTTKRAYMAIRRAPRWSTMTTEQQDVWRDKAREIVYPDLRLGYDMHQEMLQTLAIALYECSVYAKQGGGGPNGNAETVQSILEKT